MGPKFSGGACVQHLAKLRNRMQEEGIAVPPPLPRGIVTSTPSRVYSQSSGKRRRGSSDDDDEEDFGPLNPAEDAPKPATKKRKSTKKEPDVKDESHAMLDLYDSDDEYGAKQKKASKSKAKPKQTKKTAPKAAAKAAPKKTARRKSSSLEAEESIETSPAPVAAPRTRGVRVNYAQMQAPFEEDEDIKVPVGEGDEPGRTESASNEAEEDGVKSEETDAAGLGLAGGDVTQLPELPTQAFQTSPAPMTPAATQFDNNRAVGGQGAYINPFDVSLPRFALQHDANTYQFSGMGAAQPWAPSFGGYGSSLTAASAQTYPMGGNPYMTSNQSQSMYQNNASDQKPFVSQGYAAFNGGAMPTLNRGVSGAINPYSKEPLQSFLDRPDYDFLDFASVAASRTNSKESIQSQDTLAGLPSQAGFAQGEEIDVSGLSGDAAFKGDAEGVEGFDFESMLTYQ